MNLPNLLTCSRILSTVFFVFFLFSPGLLFKLLALSAFLLASITDYWDGKIARQSGEVSAFGRLMDPIADKILTLSAFFSFAAMGIFSVWLAAAVALRDFLVTGLRLSLPLESPAVSARKSGKHKTVFQIVFIVFVLLFLVWRESPLGGTGREEPVLRFIRAAMLWVAALSLWSGVRYIFVNRKFFGRK